jgi:pyruvate kinase
MLSGETAIGAYPIESVTMMNRIALATEEAFEQMAPRTQPEVRIEGLHQISEAVVAGVGLMARRLKAKLIVVASHSGATALALAKQRNYVPTLGVSDSDVTLRQMSLFWGVTPMWQASVSSTEDLLRDIEAWGRRDGMLVRGDRIILVAGTHATGSGHNAVLVHEVR